MLSSALWLPVSSTHALVGSLIGMTLALGGSDCVSWYQRSNSFPYMNGVAAILLSWLISPLFAAVLGAVIFAAVRLCVLRRKKAFLALSLAYPTLVLGTVIINLYFLLYKVAGRFSLAPEDALFKLLLRAGAGAAAAATVLATALLFPALKYAHAIKLLPQSPIGRHSARSMQEAQVTVRETQPSSKRDAQLSPRSSQSTQHSILLSPRTSQTTTRTSTSVRQSQFGRLLATNAHSHMEVQQEEGFSPT
eukprot:9116-Heterococcus_DN1.PRE.1